MFRSKKDLWKSYEDTSAAEFWDELYASEQTAKERGAAALWRTIESTAAKHNASLPDWWSALDAELSTGLDVLASSITGCRNEAESLKRAFHDGGHHRYMDRFAPAAIALIKAREILRAASPRR